MHVLSRSDGHVLNEVRSSSEAWLRLMALNQSAQPKLGELLAITLC